MKHKHFLIQAMGLLAIASSVVRAEDFARATDPITVRPGEEFRVTLFNPQETPITLKVFVYNALESNYDESPSVVIAPGRMRFFDFKAPREFVGLIGVVESDPSTATTGAKASKGMADLTNTVSYDFKSRSGIQHRGPAGQSQTLGWSWGTVWPPAGIRNVLPATVTRTQSSNWIQSAEY